jgi:hypothetical protein
MAETVVAEGNVNIKDSLTVSEVLQIINLKQNVVTRIINPCPGNVFLFRVESGINVTTIVHIEVLDVACSTLLNTILRMCYAVYV